MANILIVDDEDLVRALLSRILRRQGYTVQTASNVTEARAALKTNLFELVLCDLNMPGASGIELVQTLNAEHEDTGVVMITGVDDRDIAEVAFELGVYGYIIKPFETNEVLINVTSALRRRTLELENRQYRLYLEGLVEERTQELRDAFISLQRSAESLQASQEETIQRLTVAAEFRSDETALHTKRMSLYCELLARRAGLSEEAAERIRVASPMHDIGKIGIPDHILMKPGKLTPDEFEVMKGHAELGYRILKDSNSEMLKLAAEIAWCHHEKWDGSGYPRGLKGEEIPLVARICAIADVYDALTSKRCYKPEFEVDKARSIMMEGRGGHFDPSLLDLFWQHHDEIAEIHERYRDSP